MGARCDDDANYDCPMARHVMDYIIALLFLLCGFPSHTQSIMPGAFIRIRSRRLGGHLTM